MFHVYKCGDEEVGTYKNGSFIAKHGFDGSVSHAVTDNALKRLNGLDIDIRRRAGFLHGAPSLSV